MSSARTMTVLQAGPLTTVQDRGRFGQGSLGVGRSGACDLEAHRLANALVGNDGSAATLEVTLGGLVIAADAPVLMAVTGARCGSAPHNTPVYLRAGQRLALGAPVVGLRTYVAVRGGIDVHPVLGSRSTDTLSGLGPDPCRPGDVLPIGAPAGSYPGVEVAPVLEPTDAPVTVRVTEGPRRSWFTDQAWEVFTGQDYEVSSDSNRVGIRLTGQALSRSEQAELPSEGLLRGAVQVPPTGTPVLFLADHPVTGGYPVIAYVDEDDLDACAQLRPGQLLRFR